jgi:ADP-ribosylglycohydrolase
MSGPTEASNRSDSAEAAASLRDRFQRCLLGCAVGDALGAPYEGLWSHSIPEEGALLREFAEFEGYPRGQFTDDTQLTVATLRSILKVSDVSPAHIAGSIAALWRRQEVIGPGGACTHAALTFLRTGDWATCGAAVGQAGNGTAMRTASLGLFFLHDADRLPRVVADVSRITHQDSRSIAGGVAIAKAAQLLAADPGQGAPSFCRAVAEAITPYDAAFAEMVAGLAARVPEPPEVALPIIAWSGMARPEFDAPIITPFVIPTVLVAFWCLLRQPGSWPRAVASAIRLGGDVDTLGAIVGALAGARLGVGAIPAHLRAGVQQSEKLHELALRYYAAAMRRAAP